MLTILMIFTVLAKIICTAEGSLRIEKTCNQTKHQPIEEVIMKIIEEISKRSKCMVFVIDPHYRRLINFNWMYGISITPIYTIGIGENEIFLPPKNQLEMILKQSKASACDAYIILVTNGHQVSQFLQYAENERAINANGLFLLAHDWRLFSENMKHVWNRIINVVFIRRFNVAKRRSGEQIIHERFNLETVFYPVRVQNVVITRYLDTWSRGKFRYGTDHFASKTNDLGKTALRIAVFVHIPAVTRAAEKVFKSHRIRNNDENQDDFSEALGIEFELVRIIEHKINFSAKFYKPNNVEVTRWGSTGENYTCDGLLGEAVSRNAAFFIGDLHYTSRHNRLLDLSIPYNTECLTFLTPEALTDNSWKLLIVPFRLYTWIAVILTLIFGAYIFHLFALTYVRSMSIYRRENTTEITSHAMLKLRNNVNKRSSEKDKSLQSLQLFTERGNSVLYTCSMLLQVALPRIPTAWAVRVFIGWWWLYSILVTVAYRASMTATLANPVSRVTIDTVDDLAKSRIAIGGWNEEQKDIFLSSLDKDVREIGEKFEVTKNEEESIARVANGSFSYFENIHVLRQARAMRQKLEYTRMKYAMRREELLEADRDLHIMRECLVDMPVSIGMDKNSPLKPQVDRVIRRVIEAGFVAKWLSDVTEWSKIVELRYKSPPKQTLVNLHKLHGALVALGIGYALGMIAFVVEILHWKYVVMKNPAYDKYHMDVYYGNSRKLG